MIPFCAGISSGLNHKHSRLLGFLPFGLDRRIFFGMVKRQRLGQRWKLEHAGQRQRRRFALGVTLQYLCHRAEMQDLPAGLLQCRLKAWRERAWLKRSRCGTRPRRNWPGAWARKNCARRGKRWKSWCRQWNRRGGSDQAAIKQTAPP